VAAGQLRLLRLLGAIAGTVDTLGARNRVRSDRWLAARRWLRALAHSSWLRGSVVALLSWGVVLAGPGVGLDPSWQTGLYLAAHEHLRFGPEVVYTYGPLGFLEFPLLAYQQLVRLAFVYLVVAQLGLGIALVWALRLAVGRSAGGRAAIGAADADGRGGRCGLRHGRLAVAAKPTSRWGDRRCRGG